MLEYAWDDKNLDVEMEGLGFLVHVPWGRTTEHRLVQIDAEEIDSHNRDEKAGWRVHVLNDFVPRPYGDSEEGRGEVGKERGLTDIAEPGFDDFWPIYIYGLS